MKGGDGILNQGGHGGKYAQKNSTNPQMMKYIWHTKDWQKIREKFNRNKEL